MTGVSVPEAPASMMRHAPACSLEAGKAASGSFGLPGLRQIGCSLADQIFSVAGMFAVNVELARVQSREEYGIFTLCYSLFTFLAGMHNAAILEAYTIYGSGRYHGRFREYEAFLRRTNRWLLLGLGLALVLIWRSLRRLDPGYAPTTLLGLALTSGVLLSAAFERRTLYIRRRPDLAARFSTAFFIACCALLGVAVRGEMLNGTSAFLITALAWSIAFLSIRKERTRVTAPAADFLAGEPGYWPEHWKYSRWVFVTALVFQLTAQAYFWVVALFLSVEDVARLRAMYNLVLPVDQIFCAVSLLVLPQMASLFARNEMEKLYRLHRQCYLLFLAVSSAFALAVAVASARLLHFVYGAKFDDLAPVLRAFVTVPVAAGIGHAANAALKAVERPQAVFFAYLLGGVVTFSLGVFLVVHLGLRGAVYGMLFSTATYSAFLVSRFRRFRERSSGARF